MSDAKAAPVYLTAQQVSERWGGAIGARTLDLWRSKGKGPRFTKIGAKALYKLDDIETYEAEQSRQSTRQPKSEKA